jgi:putative NIF3 family GTP cyclohydrolase 1 type 2
VNQLLLVHPYEEVAYDVVSLQNSNPYEGAGLIGELNEPMDELEFIKSVKEIFQCGAVKYTRLLDKPIKKVAACGGSGSFLVQQAIALGADVFVTSDMKYHEFFDADNRILILDIGHYESEQYTKHLIADILKKNFTNFAIHLTERNTNPINYW